MKKISYLFLSFLLSVFIISCSKKPNQGSTEVPTITDLSRNIELPKPGDQVVVSATVITPEDVPPSSVVLKWTLNGANLSEIPMNNGGSGNVYSGNIPSQADGVVVAYTVVATNKNGTAEKTGSYTVTVKPPEITDDCTHLFLNEINGTGEDVNKYIELYNTSSEVAIRLNGVRIYYNNMSSEPAVTWTGTSGHIIYPKSFLLLKGSKTTGDLITGLSATQGIVVELFDPDGKSVDFFKIGEDAGREKSYSRIPDGTGKWYLTHLSGTPGTTNGNNLSGANPIPAPPVITNFTRDVLKPSTSNDVHVSATVRAFPGTTLTSVVLKWTVGGVSKTDITMTGNGNVYSATIPAQAASSIVVYSVVATNNAGEKEEVSESFVVFPEGGYDYSKLKLNEVSGVGNDPEKFYELINTGTEDINLVNCKLYYNANSGSGGVFPPNGNQGLTWTGNPTQTIKAGKLFSLIGRNIPGSFTTGLTPERILIITLTDPDGNTIDQCIRAQDAGDYAVGREKSFSRIPDGTGPFYFTAPTPNALNGTSTNGLLLVPTADYTKLKLNEISGVGNDPEKFYELINTGTEDINLANCKLYYNNDPFVTQGDGSLTWNGLSSQVAEGGKLFCLIGRNTPGSFTTGLTAQRNIKVIFRDPNGFLIDEFIRAQDAGEYGISDKSFSRIPDGTGPFYFTTPTPNVLNGQSSAGLILVPTTPQLPPENVDYSKLVINEIDGNGKFVEIYNHGSDAISLEKVYLVKNETQTWWTGKTGTTIAAGGYYTIAQSGGATGADEYTGASGISPKQNLKFELKDPDNSLIDSFLRSNGGKLGDGCTPDYGSGTLYSFSRCPDGTGEFGLAVPSCNKTNNTCEGEIKAL